MNYKRQAERNKAILEYRKTHTLWETALQFDLSVRHVNRIEKAIEAKRNNALSRQP